MVVWYCDKFFKISLLLGGQGVNMYLTFLRNFYEFSSPLFTGSCKICQLSVMKNLTNQNWSRGRQRNINESRYKIITKEYHKAIVSFFASWRRLRYPSLLMLWISSVCYWKTSTLFIVFTSEVTKPHHVWKSFFSSISRSQFWSINKYILCCTQHRKCNTHIIHKIRRGNGKFSSMY